MIAAGSTTLIMKFGSDYTLAESFYLNDVSTKMNILNIGSSVGGTMFALSGIYQG